MATAELALGLLAVVVMAGAALWGTTVLVQQVRTGDLAAQVARQVSRGEASAQRAVMAQERGAEVTVDHDGDVVVVTVTLPGRAMGALPAIATTATARAVMEPQP